jgi:hypothetical protein
MNWHHFNYICKHFHPNYEFESFIEYFNQYNIITFYYINFYIFITLFNLCCLNYFVSLQVTTFNQKYYCSYILFNYFNRIFILFFLILFQNYHLIIYSFYI